MEFPPALCCSRGKTRTDSASVGQIRRKEETLYQYVSTEGALRGVGGREWVVAAHFRAQRRCTIFGVGGGMATFS